MIANEPEETWFCAQCGSLDIRHDAVAKWVPEQHDYTVVAVLDDTWCEDCLGQDGSDKGDPTFGIPGDAATSEEDDEH